MNQLHRSPLVSRVISIFCLVPIGFTQLLELRAEILATQNSTVNPEEPSLERWRALRLAAAARPLPPEIVEAIRKTGRRALVDNNSDGWDDLWVMVHSFSKDGRNFTSHIQKYPEGDADGDGVSNYLEMLDRRNPWGKEPPVIILTPAQAKAARVKSYKAARANDAKCLSRFQSILEQHDVLRHEKGDTKQPSTEMEDESSPDTSFYSPFESSIEPQVMLCSTAGMPTVLFSERLSSGDYLLAWEGADDKLFDVEWSDDLETWHLGASQIPVVGGVGNWGQFTLARKRFYRITESTDFGITIPSDPEGGDGIGTFGAELTPFMSAGAPYRILVTTNLPAGVSATSVELVVDGVVHSQCQRTSSENIFSGPINRWNLTTGAHTVDAIVRVDSETPAELTQPPHGVLRSASMTFSLNQWDHGAIGFRVTEEVIAPDDPDLPTDTDIAVDIPDDPQGSGYVHIWDQDGNLIREWTWGLDSYPLEFRQTWDGTDQNGSQVPGGSYTVEVQAGGAGFDTGTIQVAAGARTWEALCLAESLGGTWTDAKIRNFLPPWAAYFSSTASDVIADAWGPWLFLRSPEVITDELCGKIKGVFGLAKSGTWKVSSWQSGSKDNSKIADPVAAFVAGGNPFNNYDLGVMIGHGAACAGGTKILPDGSAITRPPQSYYPLLQDRAAGTAFWAGSAQIPKYGSAGKLKWMFLMTCNSLTNTGDHAIYNTCKNSNTLPFGSGLRVLGGYTARIRVEAGLGGYLSDALIHEDANEEFRDGTVISAWGYVWKMSSNKANGKIARAVYWPECKDDKIHGADHFVSLAPLQNHASQVDLKEQDFSN